MRFSSRVVTALLAVLVTCNLAAAQEVPEALPVERLLEHASMHGKYSDLLKVIEVEQDFHEYGPCYDYGHWAGDGWRGHTNLPPGYWVYLYPFWYIWGERSETEIAADGLVPIVQTDGQSDRELSGREFLVQAEGSGEASREWGPEQATGPPDTEGAGDIPTAWASRSRDDQDEWILLEYEQPVVPIAVLIYETFNPGAVYRVTAVDDQGGETEIWSGDDPTAVGQEKGISVIVSGQPAETRRIVVYLKSREVAGWNEVDAVGLLDAGGATHWATAAMASTTYADANERYNTAADALGVAREDSDSSQQSLEERVRRLEKDVEQIKQQLEVNG